MNPITLLHTLGKFVSEKGTRIKNFHRALLFELAQGH